MNAILKENHINSMYIFNEIMAKKLKYFDGLTRQIYQYGAWRKQYVYIQTLHVVYQRKKKKECPF